MGNILTVISRDKSSSSKQLKERQQDLDDLHWSANGELVGFFLILPLFLLEGVFEWVSCLVFVPPNWRLQ